MGRGSGEGTLPKDICHSIWDLWTVEGQDCPEPLSRWSPPWEHSENRKEGDWEPRGTVAGQTRSCCLWNGARVLMGALGLSDQVPRAGL